MKILAIICLTLISCNSRISEKPDIWNGFDPTNLENAWTKGDSVVVIKWIKSLSDTSLQDEEFFSRVSYLSNVTGFSFGNADPSEKSYWEIPLTQREIAKLNVAKVYDLYKESCLFMNRASWEETLPLQDKFYNNSVVLTTARLQELKYAIDSLCNE